ncbi:MAG TPA: 3-hydroxybutyryl-CoA dehydrogenase [Candidatus Deferrimicrobium sp.]|nr:3-hydroxybutyryl-CoA dehydrogenase [Candidatus Deferrimicrobium sp.]
MKIKKIAVIGAGTMGAGIAQVAAQGGYRVIIQDIEQKLVDRGLSVIKQNLDRAISKGKLTLDESELIMARITSSVDLKDLQDSDLIIEAIIENMDIKKKLFIELDKVCKSETIFASNTSGLSITEMAAVTARPQQVIGMHFFNPVPVMKLVEIIHGSETNEEVVQLAHTVAKNMGKETITVKEAPLFAVNRILVPMMNEAMFVLMEGIASAEDIDKGMCLGANQPIGPLALSDLVGLDTLLFVMETLYRETSDSKYRPCPLLKQKVRAGHLGRKSGRGFYAY